MLLYIPFWLYSNKEHQKEMMKKLPLHSILVIFQQYSLRSRLRHIDLYIPFWLYSNDIQTLSSSLFRQLYIPFWFYSNVSDLKISMIEAFFTFHSGYIPINLPVQLLQALRPLHSILVIFQCGKHGDIFDFVAFTFHSGYIPIKRV